MGPLDILSCLSVCGAGVLWPNGWTAQDELGTQVGLGPGHIVLDWDPAGTYPSFSAHVRCGQTAGYIKMPLDMEVGLGPGDFVLDGDPAFPKNKGAQTPIFGPCLLRPND